MSSYSSNSSALLEVAVRTATGPLRDELERLLTYFSHATNPPTDRHLVSWDAVEALQKSFLPLDEEENLRDLLDSTKQGSNETLASFVRRFRSLANSAYPCETRNADQQRLMLKSFARGIKSAEVAKKLVDEHAPQSIETAYDIAMRLGANQLAYDRLGCREEPMEISPVAQVSGSLSAANCTNNTADLIASIASALHKLNAKLDDSSPNPTRQTRGKFLHDRNPDNKRNQRPTSKRPRHTNPLAWTPDGKPICYECSKVGHLGRECLVRQQRQWGKPHHMQGHTSIAAIHEFQLNIHYPSIIFTVNSTLQMSHFKLISLKTFPVQTPSIMRPKILLYPLIQLTHSWETFSDLKRTSWTPPYTITFI